jgi:acetyl esterase/lipase
MDCDPLVSPALASIDLLRRLPPTSIMAAGLDPLLDDSVLFAHRYAIDFVQLEITS